MEVFWNKVSIKVEKYEKILVGLGLIAGTSLFAFLSYFFFINHEKNELLFLFAILSGLVLFFCCGLGLVKYTFLKSPAKKRGLSPFMTWYASAFLSFWFIFLFIFLIVTLKQILSALF
ncbi:MAG: hypothetical protein ACLQGU_14305 [bacterium]